MDAGLPPILVLQDYRENRRKCTLEPLRGRPGIEFRTFEPIYPHPALSVEGGIVLACGAAPLSPADRGLLDADPRRAVILLDGTWARIRSAVASIRPAAADATLVHRALPPSVRTAYPRRSKIREDPEGGLASIEALAAALEILGYRALELLDGYRWREEFLRLNRDLLGAGPQGPGS